MFAAWRRRKGCRRNEKSVSKQILVQSYITQPRPCDLFMYYTGPNLALKAKHTQTSEMTLRTKKLHTYRQKTCIKAIKNLNQDPEKLIFNITKLVTIWNESQFFFPLLVVKTILVESYSYTLESHLRYINIRNTVDERHQTPRQQHLRFKNAGISSLFYYVPFEYQAQR